MEFFQILKCDPNIEPLVLFLHHGLLPIIQVGIPIILIIMGSIDLGKAVLSSDDKEIKGAVSKLIKRAIAAVAVFFVGTFVSLIMGLFAKSGASSSVEGTTQEAEDNWWDCWNL